MGEKRCGAENVIHHVQCDRYAGHPGSHWYDDGNGVLVWGFTIAAPPAPEGGAE